MIRRKTRTVKQLDALEYKRKAAIGIGSTRDEERAAEEAAERAWIGAVRADLFHDVRACQLCGGSRRRECMGLDDQMHEEPPRSKTRGLPLEERFNRRVCGRLCAACHQDVTLHRKWIIFDEPELGFIGGVRWKT